VKKTLHQQIVQQHQNVVVPHIQNQNVVQKVVVNGQLVKVVGVNNLTHFAPFTNPFVQ